MISEALYSDYLAALLRGDRGRCSALVEDLLERDLSLYTLYVDLFQRALYEVGTLWETNQISVATEHIATSITDRLLSLAYPQIFAAEHNGKRAVVSCLESEYHQLGGKMVADIFELNGWHGDFLGANTPRGEILTVIEQKTPDMLALSVSVYFHMATLYDTLDAVREAHPELPVIVGGQAFLWGGGDIGRRYRNVEYVPSIQALESML